jgi:hypothetical protein
MPNNQNLKPFKKGQSGNPDGRPPIVKDLKEFLQKRISDPALQDPEIINLEAIANKLVQLALKGNLKAIELIFNYAYGKPKEQLEKEINSPLEVRIISGTDPPPGE